MGAIKDRSIVDLESAIKFSNLTVDSCDNLWLTIMLDGVKDMADGFCNNKFVLEDDCGVPVLDEDGNEQEVDIPSGVEMWILRKFARVAHFRLSGNNESRDDEVGSIKLDKRDWAELMPFVKFNEPRHTQEGEGNLSYRAINSFGNYFHI